MTVADASAALEEIEKQSYTSTLSLPSGVAVTGAEMIDPSSASSHGDPIIWTFNNECYDLNKDGIYVASSHPKYDHIVKIAVYNDFIREIQITNKLGKILLSISNLGDTIIDSWPYRVKHEQRACLSYKDCGFILDQYVFDAQIFRYTVHLSFHDYLDPALKEGERGLHLDVFPELYPKHHSAIREYEGVYFRNPYPEELPYCTSGAERRGKERRQTFYFQQ